MITKEHVTVGRRQNNEIIPPPINPNAEIHLFGQDVNPETWAVSKCDLFRRIRRDVTPTTQPTEASSRTSATQEVTSTT